MLNGQQMTKQGYLNIREIMALKREAINLLTLINEEWQTDEMSVQCFDLRTVRRVDEILNRLKVLEPFSGVK